MSIASLSSSIIRRLTADGLELVLDYCETDLKKVVCFVADVCRDGGIY